jgi:hypothetical protein
VCVCVCVCVKLQRKKEGALSLARTVLGIFMFLPLQGGLEINLVIYQGGIVLTLILYSVSVTLFVLSLVA